MSSKYYTAGGERIVQAEYPVSSDSTFVKNEAVIRLYRSRFTDGDARILCAPNERASSMRVHSYILLMHSEGFGDYMVTCNGVKIGNHKKAMSEDTATICRMIEFCYGIKYNTVLGKLKDNDDDSTYLVAMIHVKMYRLGKEYLFEGLWQEAAERFKQCLLMNVTPVSDIVADYIKVLYYIYKDDVACEALRCYTADFAARHWSALSKIDDFRQFTVGRWNFINDVFAKGLCLSKESTT